MTHNNKIIAWAKETGKKLRISTYDMTGEEGWVPLVYANNDAAPELLDACKAALSDDQHYIEKCRASPRSLQH